MALNLCILIQNVKTNHKLSFKTEQIGTFLVGCLFSFIIAGLTVALPALKQKFMPDVADH